MAAFFLGDAASASAAFFGDPSAPLEAVPGFSFFGLFVFLGFAGAFFVTPFAGFSFGVVGFLAAAFFFFSGEGSVTGDAVAASRAASASTESVLDAFFGGMAVVVHCSGEGRDKVAVHSARVRLDPTGSELATRLEGNQNEAIYLGKSLGKARS